MIDNRDSIDFASQPIGTLFRKMFFPTLVGMISMVILNITDGAFVGHGVGSDALAAVNIVAPLFMIVGGLGLMFGIGSSVVASIHLAKQNQKAANINLTQGIIASIIIGIILGVVVFLFQQPICRLFGCSDTLIPLACSYMKWIALLTPFNMYGMVGMFTVRLDGSPRFAMILNCSMAALNIILDYVFIFPLQMGLEGAAIATTISFSLGAFPLTAYLFCYVRSIKLYRLKLSAKSFYLSCRNLLYHTRIGFSALLGELAIAAVMVVGNFVFIDYLGEDGVAAFSVGCYCLPIVFMMGNAIVQSVQPIISFAYGCNNESRLSEARHLAIFVALVSGLIGALAMWLGADIIAAVFLSSDTNAFHICKTGMPLFAPAFLFVALNIVLVGFLQATEAAVPATVFTILRGFAFSIPCFLFLPYLLNSAGLWLALPVAEALTTLLLMGYSRMLVIRK